jgi:hypothetical protein
MATGARVSGGIAGNGGKNINPVYAMGTGGNAGSGAKGNSSVKPKNNKSSILQKIKKGFEIKPKYSQEYLRIEAEIAAESKKKNK